MNREIKFRALYKHGGTGWIYWEPTQECFCDLLVYGKLDLDTFGQFTGLHDCNGKEIFEGDILGYGDNYPCIVKYQVNGSGDGEGTGFYVEEPGYKPNPPRTHSLWYQTTLPIILGNIFENKELLND